MINKSMIISLAAAAAISILCSPAAAQQECVTGEAVSALQIAHQTAFKCCGSKKKSKRNRCIKTARQRVNNARGLIGADVASAALAALDSLKAANCDINETSVPACTDDSSTTYEEAINNVSEAACDLKKECDRERRIKNLRKKALRAKGFTTSAYFSEIKSGLKSLLNSNQCGNGGSKCASGAASCKSYRGIADGAIAGNVWKRSDHGNYPVFVTHISAGSSSLITKKGATIVRGTYTGLGNGDAGGLRKHYRFYTDCNQLPSSFYMKLNSTCYEVNRQCGRID